MQMPLLELEKDSVNPSVQKLIFNKKIGEKIRNLRESKYMTQEELAQKINISQTMLSKIERGENPLSLILAKKIADILGCSLSSLANIETKGGSKHE